MKVSKCSSFLAPSITNDRKKTKMRRAKKKEKITKSAQNIHNRLCVFQMENSIVNKVKNIEKLGERKTRTKKKQNQIRKKKGYLTDR